MYIYFLKYHLIFRLYLTYPLTSVEVERVFSQVVNILTLNRNLLSIEVLNILLMIARNG